MTNEVFNRYKIIIGKRYPRKDKFWLFHLGPLYDHDKAPVSIDGKLYSWRPFEAPYKIGEVAELSTCKDPERVFSSRRFTFRSLDECKIAIGNHDPRNWTGYLQKRRIKNETFLAYSNAVAPPARQA